jgi:ribonuclease D
MIPAKNDEARMTNDERSTNAQMTKHQVGRARHHSDMVIPSSLDIRHSSLSRELIVTGVQLTELLSQIEPVERVAVDTEADSLHCYREKLCLLQISVPEKDVLVDPLANVDLASLREALEKKEIVLHGADFDLRLLRRSLNFKGRKIFDTVIAARLLGIREFSLAALVERFFEVTLAKGSQKANWARRPLPSRMVEYAINDTHYLLPLAEKLERQLRERDRFEWFRQSCQRALEQTAVERVRDLDDAWRISGAGTLRGPAAAVLRALWQWREKEAEAADRPPFHILQNHELLEAAESFAKGGMPDFSHFSARRRGAFREAAERALKLPEEAWPLPRPRLGTRPTAEMKQRMEELRRRRDHGATRLELDPAFVAPRAALEALATNEKNGAALLVPWQRQVLGIPA